MKNTYEQSSDSQMKILAMANGIVVVDKKLPPNRTPMSDDERDLASAMSSEIYRITPRNHRSNKKPSLDGIDRTYI